ncbi:HlyD family type I secretion periplasmic adaptor subunit [Enterobacter roggenkampii]|uniref:HlyD family type I secretion periplasmic adaptor subunit n=1 Tax=Enterobacter roggenkampii TaxID=1812935 RepID=UPI002DBE1917|nr:HlyD family type I secretion periplasmic adaptor subunit [Enterobacter roggenkampii]MEB5887484.1 HlyD family type I secretion periplasmic adaptor subunit [Enterobacter roggenkampii]
MKSELFLLCKKWVLSLLRPETRPRPEEYEFHPGYLEILERPPAPWARKMAAGLVITFGGVLCWSVWGKMDIQANASGRLLISSHSKVIQPLENGEITDIAVHDGQRVHKGDLLVRLNPVSTDSEVEDLRAQLHYSLAEEARLKTLLSGEDAAKFVPPQELSTEEIARTRAHLESARQERQARLDSLNDELRVNLANQQAVHADVLSLEKLDGNILQRLGARQKLLATQVVSRNEYLESEKEHLDVSRELSQKKESLSVLKAEMEKTKQQKTDYLAQLQRENYDQLIKTHNETEQLRARLLRAHEHARQQTLLSPVNGIVQQLAVHTLGGVVQSAQQLMVIVPENAPQEAEVMVLNKDVGFVREGQSVEIKVDAFPYTRYGTLHGNILHVSRDAVKDEKLGLVFPAQISLSHSSMDIDGHTVPLQAGMSMTADIKTGERRVIDYLLSPLQQYASEALRER